MKIPFTLALLAILCTTANAQLNSCGIIKTGNIKIQTSPMYIAVTDTVISKAAFLKKSKTQKTIGWAMLGGGVAMIVGGGGLFVNNFELFSRKHDDAAGAGVVLFLCGAGSTLGSIPFFISSAHNAKNAARISMGSEEIFVPQQNNYTVKMQPSVTFTIQF